MESTLVIKVKYGDTLRRFNAAVDEDNRLDLNMAGLRFKICSIFNFAADANLILTYVDEDGDLVTLADDDDLRDVMRQQLKFLRIDVQMVGDNVGDSNAGSSGSAAPLKTPPVSKPFDFVKAEVFDALPEPLREVLYSSLSKAASSSPVLATLADSITKIGQSILNSHPQPHAAAGTGSANSVPEASVTSEAKGPQSPHVASASNASVPAMSSGSATPLLSKLALNQERLSKLAALNQAAASSQVHANLSDLFTKKGQSPYAGSVSTASRLPEAGNASHYSSLLREPPFAHVATGQQPKSRNPLIRGGLMTGGVPAPVDLNIPPPCFCFSSDSTNVNSAPVSAAVPVGDSNKGKMSTDDSFAGKGESSGTSASFTAPRNSSTQTTGTGFGAPNYFPFPGTIGFHSGASSLGNSRTPPLSSFNRSHSHIEAMRGMFHKGVRCDGCGVYPITGPRFKSKVKENYDLCTICFNKMGKNSDYIRMDRPESAWGCPRRANEHPAKFPTIPPLLNRLARPKLDSRFILDVNIIDGTMMAPSTAFTKIWRMRNSGTSVWPKGTELVWIGGDEFCDSTAAKLEAPEDGVPVGKELDIAVDFRAPQLPGRYISHWRMASPSGHEFGQCVWVLIQVDASVKDTIPDSFQNLNLNIPLDVSGSQMTQVIDINVQPTEEDASLQQYSPSAPTEPMNQMVDKEPRQEEPAKEFATNEAAFVDPATSHTATSEALTHLPYPNIDIDIAVPAPTDPAPAVLSNLQTSAVDAPLSTIGIGGNNSVEETLLKELEMMGFNQVDLNKYVLRMNDYNLEQAVDDLCGGTGWDPILEELKEMGFRDDEKNRRLLMKNNGSIKGAVMDLINGE